MSFFTYLQNVLSLRCPRCHKGKLFTHGAYNLSHSTDMVSHCKVCGQRTELEPGFYFGTGYVSYALTVAFSVAMFVFWLVVIGISLKDNSIFWWLGTTIVLLVLLQPIFMRMSRAIWLSWFYKKDDNLHNHPSDTK